jgi:hypothetical protein
VSSEAVFVDVENALKVSRQFWGGLGGYWTRGPVSNNIVNELILADT